MTESMDAARIIDYFKGKTILITGSTGFLGKILVEKILRVQPDVSRIYLLVRAIDAPSAQQRVQQEVLLSIYHEQRWIESDFSNSMMVPINLSDEKVKHLVATIGCSVGSLLFTYLGLPLGLSKVTGTELFSLLRQNYGEGFDPFIQEKVVPLAGDITKEDLGLDPTTFQDLAKEMDVIVNIAATTNFYQRYDVALGVNVLGVKHLYQFAKQCANLKMFMHVSTAYVSGDSTELIMEKPIKPGEALREGMRLDIDDELRLVTTVKNELTTTTTTNGDDDDASAAAERTAMKELGIQRARHFGWSNTYVFTKAMGEMLLGQLQHQQLHGDGDGDDGMPVVIVRPSIITSVRSDPVAGWMQGTRTIDTLIIGYAKRKISAFLADLRLVMDVVPGDMVVNAMLAAVVAHSPAAEHGGGRGGGAAAVTIYQPTSSLRNPVTYAVLYRCGKRHFKEHPRLRENGKVVPNNGIRFFSTIPRFRLYMILSYKLPLEMLHMANLLLCGSFSQFYTDSNREYKFVMQLVDVYGPFAFFKGCFDDTNMERLRSTMVMKTPEDQMFNFDPKTIDWDDYFYRIHIPGVLKYVCK